ncbi:MAG: hypothetical protein AAFX10_01515 [Pseudomonadota bacterium]
MRRAIAVSLARVTGVNRLCKGMIVGGLLVGAAALADDTEILLVDPEQPPKPNVLFVLDTSTSMASAVETNESFDSDEDYPGDCSSNRLYWSDVDAFPDCDNTQNYIRKSAFECQNATSALESVGAYTDTMVQYRGGDKDGNGSNPPRWQNLAAGYDTESVECQADSGVHGDGRSNHLYAAGGTDLSDPFTTQASEELSWGSAPRNVSYTVYDGNYLNWQAQPDTSAQSLTEIMQTSTKAVLDSLDNMNVGIMRFNNDAGGPVIFGLKDLETNRSSVEAVIDGLPASGFSPLSETLYESALYWRGENAFYGELVNETDTDLDALASSSPEVYAQPSFGACAKNYAVILTDGEPSEDLDTLLLAPTLPGFTTALGRTACDGTGEGRCLDDIAEYLSKIDLDPDAPGDQSVITHTIGYNVDLPLLAETAADSGGLYFRADDMQSLTRVMQEIVGNVTERGLSFVTPTIPVNSFNLTQNLDQLYYAVFGVRGNVRWPGNLKRYAIQDGVVVDADGSPAIDPGTGQFSSGARSFWSPAIDGNDVELGGAANRIPDAITRNVYTNISGNALTAGSNAVRASNLSSFSDEDLGLTGSSEEPSKLELVLWMRGVDAFSGSSLVRQEMGDPLHSQPAAVVYGGSPLAERVVVFVATNEGYLHAIDGQTGTELWSFIPREFLSNMTRQFFDPAARYKNYGIDGNIVPVIKDVDGDGEIEPSDGDFVYIIFGMRRGGTTYYALDVKDIDAPRVLWTAAYPEFGESWSTPSVAKIDIAGVPQNSDDAVVVIGGGYDTVHDTAAYNQNADSVGAGVHMLDLVTGQRLWRAGPDSGANLDLPTMTRAIPTSVRVIDINGDTFADRMYASDLGGQIWRFDINNGASASGLVTGGVIAQLGAEGTGNDSPADTRRFYNAPDVSLVSDPSQQSRFLAVSIGSGYRAHPLDSSATDRFYSLRDGAVFDRLTQDQYNNFDIITDSDLVEVSGQVQTIVGEADRGWKFTLPPDEKVLTDSVTFNNELFFVSYSPNTNSPPGCSVAQGRNTLYRMSIINGDPLFQNLETLPPAMADAERAEPLAQGGIAPNPIFVFPGKPTGCTSANCIPPPIACVGVECFDPGFVNNPVRTLWTQDGID